MSYCIIVINKLTNKKVFILTLSNKIIILLLSVKICLATQGYK